MGVVIPFIHIEKLRLRWKPKITQPVQSAGQMFSEACAILHCVPTYWTNLTQGYRFLNYLWGCFEYIYFEYDCIYFSEVYFLLRHISIQIWSFHARKRMSRKVKCWQHGSYCSCPFFFLGTLFSFAFKLLTCEGVQCQNFKVRCYS